MKRFFNKHRLLLSLATMHTNPRLYRALLCSHNSYRESSLLQSFFMLSTIFLARDEYFHRLKTEYFIVEFWLLRDVVENNERKLRTAAFCGSASFKNDDSFRPFATFDGSEGYSFESATYKELYSCVPYWFRRLEIDFGFINLGQIVYSIEYATRLCGLF